MHRSAGSKSDARSRSCLRTCRAVSADRVARHINRQSIQSLDKSRSSCPSYICAGSAPVLPQDNRHRLLRSSRLAHRSSRLADKPQKYMGGSTIYPSVGSPTAIHRPAAATSAVMAQVNAATASCPDIAATVVNCRPGSTVWMISSSRLFTRGKRQSVQHRRFEGRTGYSLSLHSTPRNRLGNASYTPVVAANGILVDSTSQCSNTIFARSVACSCSCGPLPPFVGPGLPRF